MSTPAKLATKKRKRDPSPAPKGIAFEISPHTQGEIGPALVSFPALEAPSTTAFKCYGRKKAKTKGKDEGGETKDLHIIVGETDSVEFVTNEEESRRAADGGCRYLLALHNPRTSSLTLLPNPVSPHILKRTVKALKFIAPTPAPSALEYREARTALGETFGTKKAKAAIRAQERNRVDVGAMEGVMGYVMDGIEKGAEGLMTAEEAKTIADSNRLIPPFSVTATDPADVYPLHDIISDVEWKALDISVFEGVELADAEKALPFRHSSWINQHVKVLIGDTGKGRKKNLKIILYISMMLAFRRATDNKSVEKDSLREKLSRIPAVVLDTLLARFTEVSRGSTKHQSTTATQTNLLTHIFTLCLKVDSYVTDPEILAHDISLPVIKVVGLFKSLGCKVSKITERERNRLGLSESMANQKLAILSAPIVFPKPKRRRK